MVDRRKLTSLTSLSIMAMLLCAPLHSVVYPSSAPTPIEQADHILVVKSEHTLTLLSHGKAIKVYKVALGSGGLGPKNHEGDRLTPEGNYIIDAKIPRPFGISPCTSPTPTPLTKHAPQPNISRPAATS